ncbi:MAG TPA: hypothetical protein VF454_01880, partial [Gemmatimonadales bacterium]
MRSATLFSAGSWALALLVGFFIWLSPDAGLYPAPAAAALVVGLAFLVWVAGAVMTAFPRSAPRLSFGAQAGGVAPVFAAALALLLAGHGLLPHPALPMVFILLAGVAGLWWARRSGTQEATRGQEMGLSLLLVPIILIVGPALLLAVYGQEIWKIAAPNYATMIDRYDAAESLSPFRPTVRGTITPEAAGMALMTISNTGDSRREAYFIETPTSIERPWLADSGPFGRQPGDSVMRRALAGLTREERAWLEAAARHPGVTVIDTVAYARRLDPWVGLKLPLPAEMNAFTMPLPSTIPIRNAGRLQLYRAALAAADHKPAVAESLARNALGFGLRLHDDADQLILGVVGAAIAREAGASLALLQNAKGHTPRGDSLAERSAFRPGIERSDSALDGVRPMAIRRQMIEAILAHAAPRPVQWDIAGILGVSRCTDLRELLYGPSEQLGAAYESLRGQVGSSEQAQAAFTVVGR